MQNMRACFLYHPLQLLWFTHIQMRRAGGRSKTAACVRSRRRKRSPEQTLTAPWLKRFGWTILPRRPAHLARRVALPLRVLQRDRVLAVPKVLAVRAVVALPRVSDVDRDLARSQPRALPAKSGRSTRRGCRTCRSSHKVVS